MSGARESMRGVFSLLDGSHSASDARTSDLVVALSLSNVRDASGALVATPTAVADVAAELDRRVPRPLSAAPALCRHPRAYQSPGDIDPTLPGKLMTCDDCGARYVLGARSTAGPFASGVTPAPQLATSLHHAIRERNQKLIFASDGRLFVGPCPGQRADHTWGPAEPGDLAGLAWGAGPPAEVCDDCRAIREARTDDA